MHHCKQSSHIHYIPQDGRTALYQASAYGHSKVVDLLTKAGAAVDVQEEVNIDVIDANNSWLC